MGGGGRWPGDWPIYTYTCITMYMYCKYTIKKMYVFRHTHLQKQYVHVYHVLHVKLYVVVVFSGNTSQDGDRPMEMMEVVHPTLGGGMLLLDKVSCGSPANSQPFSLVKFLCLVSCLGTCFLMCLFCVPFFSNSYNDEEETVDLHDLNIS